MSTYQNMMDQITALTSGIRQRWGNAGDWNAQGVDRAQELARLLAGRGVTDLNQLRLSPTTQTIDHMGGPTEGGYENPWTETKTIQNLLYGDQNLGFLGDVNRDGGLSLSNGQRGLDSTDLGNLLGWSSAGKGNVSYVVENGPNGLQIVPKWKSSSEGTMQDIMGTLGVLGGAAGMNSLFGGIGSTGALPAGAGASSGIGASGIQPLSMTDILGAMAPGDAAFASGSAALKSAGAGLNGAGLFDMIGGGADGGMGAGGAGADAMPKFGADFTSKMPLDLGEMAYNLNGLDLAASVPTAQSFNAGMLASGGGMFSPMMGGGAVGAAANSATPWLDQLLQPKNLIGAVGAIGSLFENGKGTDQTATLTKQLDPRVSDALFGADGKGGLVGDAMAWKNANPTGQNATMVQAQQGLRNFLLDPRIMQGYYQMGGAGMGLMNTPVAPNPWRP